MPTEVLAAEEGAAFGAALLAGVGVGGWPTVEHACDGAVRVSTIMQPQPRNVALLNRQYGAYQKLYPALRQIGEEFQEI
jgi:xylulokinase